MSVLLLVALVVAILTVAQVWGFAVGPPRPRRLNWPRVAIAWAASAWLTGIVLRLVNHFTALLAPRRLTLGESLAGMAIIAAVAFGAAGLLYHLTPLRNGRVSAVAAISFGLNCVVAGGLTVLYLGLLSLPPH